MKTIIIEVSVIVALLLCNGVFAMSEIAVVTSRRSRIEARKKANAFGAARALTLMDDPTRFLATVQIGITLVGVLAGAFGGATLAAELDAVLERIPALAAASEALALGVVVAAVSFCSLVIGELVPKRIAMQSPERIAQWVALPMHWLAKVAAPLVYVLTKTTQAILRLLRVPEAGGSSVTEDEIRAMIAEGRRSGAVHVSEHRMLEGVFRLGDQVARDLMTPRPELAWVDVRDGVEALREQFARPGVDTVLVCRGSVDHVVGVVRPPAVIDAALAGRPIDLERMADPPLFVPASMSVLRLLERFKEAKQRVAIVLDEYGGVDGAISIGELLEVIVGDVALVAGDDEPVIAERSDGTWLVDGFVDIDAAVGQLGLTPPPEGERGSYRTIAGFVMARIGGVPRVGDAFVYGGAIFEIVDLDGRRIDKVLVRRASGETNRDGTGPT